MKNGNGKKSIKILQWNLGPRAWENKTEDIQQLVDEHNPCVAFITEANFWEGISSSQSNILGYQIIKPKTISLLGYSRIIALVKDGTKLRIMDELMDREDLSNIWLKTVSRGNKGIIIGGIYREHSLLGIDNSSIPSEQLSRWKATLAQWKKAGRLGQCITIGDMNLDMSRWHNPEQAHIDMTEETKNVIETENFTQLIDTPTRFWANQIESTIDHIWVNRPQMVLDVQNIRRPVADHNLIVINYRTKGTLTNPLEIIKRSLTNFDPKMYLEEIKKINWEPMYHFREIDPAITFFQENVLQIYNKMAPMKKIQPRKRNSNWVTFLTREKMLLRDQKHFLATSTQKNEDWLDYRILRNLCTKMVKSDRKLHFQKMNKIFEEENDSKGLYNHAKNRMGVVKNGKPTFFTVEGKIITSPKMLANIQIEYFHKKIEKLTSALPPPPHGPPFLPQGGHEQMG